MDCLYDGVAIFDGERLICGDEGVTCPVRSLDITRLKGLSQPIVIQFGFSMTKVQINTILLD